MKGEKGSSGAKDQDDSAFIKKIVKQLRDIIVRNGSKDIQD